MDHSTRLTRTARFALVGAATALAATALATVAGIAVPHAATAAAAKHRVLFDNSKAETAGNADWIIGTGIPDPTTQNPNPTSETSWTGALSAWGVALQRTGAYTLATLAAGKTITYGNTANAQDLANFDEFVLPEPNVLLSAAEKTAVMKFVQNGGGLFIVVDHTGSDRNNDGADSPKVINDLMTNNSVDSTDPFGFSVDLLNIASGFPRAVTAATNPVLHGSFGNVTGGAIYNGTTVTLHPANNPNAKGLLYVSGATPGGNTGAFFATSTFGSGRVAIWGDSSDIDDGTGQSGNTLYDGWNDTGATNAALALNATEWLAGTGTTTPPSPSPAPTGGTSCTPAQLLVNPGFEAGPGVGWTATSGVITNSSGNTPHSNAYYAWLDGYGTAHTDTLAQAVTIPASCATATFSFWLHVGTAETTTTTAYDTLKAQVLNSSGTVLTTLATFSNLNAATGYTQRSYNLAAYRGSTVTLKFTGVEGSTLQTSFLLDDTALNVS
ncbi:hypothetical protein Cs7R123_44910 [Catellatospora sp. TT07R-123]|uniref:hydrolase n=1 Tax=Catellatospora sp. TT07R-123 TaxID=2733863 RepID=UPI001B0ACF44|nr:hydrolase [Catellatospora sp. TT07R-123]GHJ47149.1 hypothetical protein Cs7R123_44910 [Catellatospora sp. TT07R-123]